VCGGHERMGARSEERARETEGVRHRTAALDGRADGGCGSGRMGGLCGRMGGLCVGGPVCVQESKSPDFFVVGGGRE
jgi:hypothetical protein